MRERTLSPYREAMSFPVHDRAWMAVAAFVEQQARPGETILGDDLFAWRFPVVHRYHNTWCRPEQRYDWAILHKGMLDRVAAAALDDIVQTMHPAFANDVFVVWSSRPARDPVEERHVDALRAALATIDPATQVEPPDDGEVRADPGVIVQYRTLDDEALRHTMDAFWRQGGYEYPTRRDVLYNAALDDHVRQVAEAGPWPRVLDLGCGVRPLPPGLAGGGVVRADLSVEAVRRARAVDAAAGRSFATVDGAQLPFPDGAFDLLLFVEAIEHVLHVDRVLDEIARVLRPGGTLLVTVANRDSLHLRLTRAMGFEGFLTNYQHITEMTYAELAGHLTRRGLEPQRAEGVQLHPYWAVPGMPPAVAQAIDDDPDLVAALVELGALAGPTYAFTALVVAEKVRPSPAPAPGA